MVPNDVPGRTVNFGFLVCNLLIKTFNDDVPAYIQGGTQYFFIVSGAPVVISSFLKGVKRGGGEQFMHVVVP